jgi:hypothetical protein
MDITLRDDSKRDASKMQSYGARRAGINRESRLKSGLTARAALPSMAR